MQAHLRRIFAKKWMPIHVGQWSPTLVLEIYAEQPLIQGFCFFGSPCLAGADASALGKGHGETGHQQWSSAR